MRNSILISLIFFLQNCTVYCENEAERIVRQRMESTNTPGMVFLIAKDGKVIDEGYYGKANVELDADITKSSNFAIASMSKTYTAAAILLMAENGLLDLEDSVKKYIPEAPDSWQTMTIKHLLMHSSGLVEDWELHDWNKSNEMFLKTQTNEEFLKVHFNQELKFKPGTDNRYASGHFVLGIVIERIAGSSYEEYLEEKILGPLSLKETFVDHPYKIIPHRVSGYFDYDPAIINGPVSGIGNGILIAPVAYGRGDAGIRTTAYDLLKFYNALFTDDFLSDQSRSLMFEPTRLDNGDKVSYGAGWMNWPLGGLAVSEHSGVFRTGFSSQALLVPKDKFVVIILTNLRGSATFTLAKELASLYYPELEKLSKKFAVKDSNMALTNVHLEIFQTINSKKENVNIHMNFPFSYYSKPLKESISSTESITFLGERDLQDQKVEFFGVDIQTLRYYRLNGKKVLYTTVYLDKSDKLVFIDYPETE
ncbi:serine hydrolase domain-containing protein [Kangiella shandongensis]|uniref:serine hydrolase domain-containing protein n=1 Tax=Kangiella shandongensis TaxID=2763258 RepID=UPI001CC059C7|nr:serine hydrolase domain-containing protein [Kangiella shandongensis]